MSTAAESLATLGERFALKVLVECCLMLEEGVASAKDIDLAGSMAGPTSSRRRWPAPTRPGSTRSWGGWSAPRSDWGEDFVPPTILRRLVAQGRLGVKSGQGFFPYARPDAGWEERPVKLETRGPVAIAWLDRPPANSLSPEMLQAIQALWDDVGASGEIRALIFASANPMLFCAGADIKAFASMDAAGVRQQLDHAHALFRSMEQSSVVTIAAVNAAALGGGCELAMACDFRIAADRRQLRPA